MISAILLLMQQQWRNSIQPFAEGDDDLRRYVRQSVSSAFHTGPP